MRWRIPIQTLTILGYQIMLVFSEKWNISNECMFFLQIFLNLLTHMINAKDEFHKILQIILKIYH